VAYGRGKKGRDATAQRGKLRQQRVPGWNCYITQGKRGYSAGAERDRRGDYADII